MKVHRTYMFYSYTYIIYGNGWEWMNVRDEHFFFGGKKGGRCVGILNQRPKSWSSPPLPVQAADNAPAAVGAGAVAAKILEVGCRWSAKV